MAKKALRIISILTLGGTVLVLMFLNLSGISELGVLGDIYLTKVYHRSGASKYSRTYTIFKWSLYRLCSYKKNGRQISCTLAKAAFPYSPEDNFTKVSIYSTNFFADNMKLFFYGTRLAYGFLLSAFILSFLSFICQIVVYLFAKWYVSISSILVTVSFITHVVGLVIQMGFHIRGVYAWRSADEKAQVGTSAFLLMSLGILLLLLCTILSWKVSGILRKQQQDFVAILYGISEECFSVNDSSSSSEDTNPKEICIF